MGRPYMPRVYLCAHTPALSPEDAALRLAALGGLCWLDGGLTYGREGRWSFVAAAPVETRAVPVTEDAWAALTALPAAETALPAGAPLSAGDVPAWAGYIAYDAHVFTRAKAGHARVGHGLRLARYEAWLAWDHGEGRSYLVGDDEAACARLAAQLGAPPAHALPYAVGPLEGTPGAQHAAAIARALGHVRDGDVYEINLARRFRAQFRGSALGLFSAMRALSPVPLGMFQDFGDAQLLGRSMERYLRYERASGRVWTSPIKGTVPASLGADAGDALRADPKEHAEHAMVVDLMRNDLSRVCRPGSVRIAELMGVYPFAGLTHLVSTVAGAVRPDVALADVVRETFPPGSVSGTPKQRALELIEALEPAARGVYTGAYGFVDRAGGCSWAVAIRTAFVAEGAVTYWAGGGIVAASVPEREVAETELKAAMFVRAAGV
jgi:anthranilate/para-aminobenzoate synthase component I